MPKVSFISILFFFIFCIINWGYTEVPQQNNELESELESVDLQIKFMKLKVSSTKKKLRSLERRAKNKKSELLLLSKQFEKLSAKKQTLRRKLDEIKSKIALIRKKTKNILLRYRKSLVQLHKIKQNTLVSSAFSSKSLNLFLNKYQMVKYMLKNDKKIVESIKLQSQEFANKKQMLAKTTKGLSLLEFQLKEKKQKLQIASKSLRAMLSTLILEKKMFLARQKKLQKSRTKLNEKIKAIEKERKRNEKAFDRAIAEDKLTKVKYGNSPVEKPNNISRGSGANMMQLIWPVDRANIQNVLSPKNNEKAIDIYLKGDTEIHATARGKIMYKGNLGSLGNVVIIGHKRGFSSVYAGLNDIWTGLGQVVSQGEVIGKIYSNMGSLLHFEVRFGGKKKAPLSYLPALKDL